MTITVGSLFSGIGGIDLGLERAGMETRWQVEFNPFCRQILEKHWPHVPKFDDIKEVNFHELERVDLLCGGFPCQPVSLAGRRKGQEDERWLWPEYARAIREVGPRWVLVENVPGLMSKGFGDVATDLAALGYDFEWDRIPAAAVGAPHLRFRVIIVAHSGSARRREDARSAHGDEGADARGTTEDDHQFDGDGESRRAEDVANTHPIRRIGWPRVLGTRGGSESPDGGLVGSNPSASESATDAEGLEGRLLLPECGGERAAGESGLGGWRNNYWLVEPDVGRVANGVPQRVDRLKALGNSVVPQIFEWVGRRIVAADQAWTQ